MFKSLWKGEYNILILVCAAPLLPFTDFYHYQCSSNWMWYMDTNRWQIKGYNLNKYVNKYNKQMPPYRCSTWWKNATSHQAPWHNIVELNRAFRSRGKDLSDFEKMGSIFRHRWQNASGTKRKKRDVIPHMKWVSAFAAFTKRMVPKLLESYNGGVCCRAHFPGMLLFHLSPFKGKVVTGRFSSRKKISSSQQHEGSPNSLMRMTIWIVLYAMASTQLSTYGRFRKGVLGRTPHHHHKKCFCLEQCEVSLCLDWQVREMV